MLGNEITHTNKWFVCHLKWIEMRLYNPLSLNRNIPREMETRREGLATSGIQLYSWMRIMALLSPPTPIREATEGIAGLSFGVWTRVTWDVLIRPVLDENLFLVIQKI